MTFSTISYGELWQRVRAAASSLHAKGAVARGDYVGIYADAGVDWVVADLACLYLGAVSVPMQRGASLDDLVHVARETELACIFVDGADAATTARLCEQYPRVRDVVVMGPIASARADAALRVHDLGQLIAEGARGDTMPSVAAAGDELFSVVYTSGSTGRPKGVMVTERRWAETLGDSLQRTPIPTVTVGYLPFSHMAGRISLYTTMMVGGQVNVIASDEKSRLMEAIRATRPTVLTLVPRVSSLIHQKFLGLALGRNVDLAGGYGDARVEEVLRIVRDEWLGGRLCFATTGAAPTAPDVARFVSEGLGVHVIDAYGSTEVARIAVNGLVQADVAYRLVDLPELGYTTRDRPYPRGELAVKSPRQTPGYFKNAEANASLYDADGFIRTGDIVEERAPRHIVWIDRKSDVVRLTNGVNVNVSRLESLFETHSPHIEQIFICGESNGDYLLAVVVPSASLLSTQSGAGEERHRAAERLLHSDLTRVAAEHRLPSHEVPRGLLLADAPFTRENGLLSDARKYRRPKIRECYRARLHELCSSIAARQVGAQLRADDLLGRPIEERFRAAVSAVLGRRELDESDLARSFVNLGGDSLAAIRVRDVLGDRLDLSAVLDRDKSLRSLLETLKHTQAERDGPAARTLHGDGEQLARVGDFQLSGLLPQALLSASRRLPLSREPRHILLTGATGFLGHVVLEALLEKLEQSDCSITCLVRAPGDAAARERVAGKLETLGAAAASRLAEWTQRSRLRVVAGDVASPGFGLDASVYADLAERVDTVLHSGALVNHLLSYSDLFAPNVRGTLEVMRFAISSRRKRLHFVSTTALAAGWKGRAPVPEEHRASALWQRRRLDAAGYASGYATSKWASEILLSNLHDACDVPVAVYRCSMILPHRDRAETFNGADSFSRLLYGIVHTGVAPTSFYAEDYDGDRHYDGLPVDLVAAVIADSCVSPAEHFRIYHLSNPNWDDGVCIDRIVSWAAAGYPVERLEHAAWHAEFVRRLHGLSGEAQRRSPEQIADRWREPIAAGKGSFRLATGNFRAALARIGVEAIPSLDEAYIQRAVRGICGANR